MRHGRQLAVSVLLVLYLGMAVLGFRAPLTYDEGYNLQVPVNLVESGEYATNGSLYEGSHLREFDALISTGPTVLLPVALAIWVLPDDLTAARLVPTAFFLLLGLLTWILGYRLSGFWGGWFSALSILTINAHAGWPGSIIFGPGDVLGEYPAAALLVGSAIILPRRWFVSGVLVGLAILAKLLAVFAVPAFLIGWMLSDQPMPRRAPARFLVGLLGPIFVWVAVRWSAMGNDLFIARAREFWRFVGSGGSGLASSGGPSLIERLVTVVHSWSMPVLPLLVVLLTWLTVSAIVRSLPSAQLRRRLHQLFDGDFAPASVLTLTGLAIGAWWLTIAERAYSRHLLLGLLVSIPAMTALLIRGVAYVGTVEKPSRGFRLVAVMSAVVMAASAVATVHRTDSPPGLTLDQQEQAAAALVRNGSRSYAFSPEWWQAPELAFLSGLKGVHFHGGHQPLVIGLTSYWMDPASVQLAEDVCDHDVYHQDGYWICVPR